MKDNTTGGEGLREAVLSVLDFHQIREKLSDEQINGLLGTCSMEIGENLFRNMMAGIDKATNVLAPDIVDQLYQCVQSFRAAQGEHLSAHDRGEEDEHKSSSTLSSSESGRAKARVEVVVDVAMDGLPSLSRAPADSGDVDRLGGQAEEEPASLGDARSGSDVVGQPQDPGEAETASTLHGEGISFASSNLEFSSTTRSLGGNPQLPEI